MRMFKIKYVSLGVGTFTLHIRGDAEAVTMYAWEWEPRILKPIGLDFPFVEVPSN